MTNSKGEVVFFLPTFGYLILLMGIGLYLVRQKQFDLGSRQIWIPMLVIIAAIGLSGITADTISEKVAPLGAGASFFALYIASRKLGKDIFLPLAIGAAIGSLGILLHQLIYPGKLTGGFIFEHNYDIATGYILLGTSLFIHKWRWALALLAATCLILSGSAEAVFAVGVIVVIMLIRKDLPALTRTTIGIAAIPLLVLVLFFGSGAGFTVQKLTAWAATGDMELLPSGRNPDRGTALERRWEGIEQAMANIKPLGEGYILTDFSRVKMVHNMPLVIVQQLGWPGILAGLAWLWVSIYCLIKTRLKYTWALVLSLSLWDHYVWTQLAPWWWAIAGVSTAGVNTDWIFRYADSKTTT